jgi:glyoxylase-like metal-dependent hydrolase (beta-lactamase superfamily II)
VSVRVGSIEVVPIVDAVGRLGELAELYPEVAAEDWEPYRARYPDLFAGSEWLLPCTSYLVRSGETTVLVDTGVGPSGLWGWNAEWEGGLPERLEELGVGRDEIDVVFLTHLHIDHVGWNAGEDGIAFFPKARYVVHRDALAFATSQDERPHVQRCIVSLADRFETVEDGAEIAPEVTAVALPGHYPGHLGLRVACGGEELLLMADAAVHPALLDHPEWRYISDGDHEQCVKTRRGLVDDLTDSDVLVACGHYPQGGIGRIVRRNGAVVWEAA